MDKKRFTKLRALKALDKRAVRIAMEQSFDLSNGTEQLSRGGLKDAEIERAVEYGRMIAFQEFKEAIEEDFRFED